MKDKKPFVDALLDCVFEDEYKKEFFKKRWTRLGLRLLIGAAVLLVLWAVNAFS